MTWFEGDVCLGNYVNLPLSVGRLDESINQSINQCHGVC